jgi:branched-chain amino acid transport system substrate-binding protein
MKRIKTIGALLLMLTAVAAGQARAADPGVTDDEILIGMFAPLSGPLAAFGTDTLNAARMVYDQANKAGGIYGRKIRTIVEDDKCNPNETNAIALKLVTVDHVFMLHGGSCTAAAVTIQSYVTRMKVPFMMLNASGDPALFPPSRYVFGGFGGTQGGIGASIVQFPIEKLKAKKIAYITSDDDFGTSNYTAAKAAVAKLGGEIVAYERVPNNIVDVTPTMLRVRQANPDVIVSAVYPQGAVLIAQARANYGMTQPLVQAAQGITNPGVFAKNVGDPAALRDFYYSSAAGDLIDGPKLKDAYSEYRAAYPDRTTINFLMVMGIPSAQTIVKALQGAGRDLTRENFIDALEKVRFVSPELAAPVAFSPERHDALRGQIIVKFDGTNSEVVGQYEWDGSRQQ